MGTKSSLAKHWYDSKITVAGTELEYSIPLDKNKQLILPEMKQGEVICKIKLNKHCSKEYCLNGCFDNLEKIICKRIVSQRNKIHSDV